ncbi:MAG: tetratricopeptide repeat protein [Phycisphaerales bacterium]
MISPGKEHADTVSSMNTLATAEADLGRFDESEKLYLDAIATQEKLSGPDHALVLEVKANLAWMLYWAAMQDKAIAAELKPQRLQRSRVLGEQVLDARKRVLGEDHPETLTTMNNLASTYRALGIQDKADALSRAELETSIRVLGEDHPDTITSLANMGASLRGQHKYEEALPYLERAIRASRKVLAPDNPGTAYALGWYGSCLTELGRYAEAEPPLLEARAIAAKALGEDNNITQHLSQSLATLYTDWNKAEPGKGFEVKADEWKTKAATHASASDQTQGQQQPRK